MQPDYLYLLDSPSPSIDTECDEHRHISHDPKDEARRMFNICRALNTKVIFIRCNPDFYKTKFGPMLEEEERLEILRHAFEKMKTHEMKDFHCGVVCLCYDYFDKDNIVVFDLEQVALDRFGPGGL